MFERLRSSRYWALQLGLAGCWIASWHSGRLLEPTTHASLWFPPAAMTFAMFAVEGPLAFPAVMGAAIVTSFQSAAIHGDGRAAGAILVSAIGFGLAHSLAYGSGAGLFNRLDRAERLGTPGSVVGFLLAATLSSLLGAVMGFEALAVTGEAIPGELAENLVAWWIGDLAAVVTLVPVLLPLVDWGSRIAGLPVAGWAARLRRLGLSDLPLSGFMLKLAIAVGLVVGFAVLAAVGSLGVPVALAVYVVIVPLMWIAHADGGLRTMVAVAVLALAVVATTRLLGLTEQAFNYQAAMLAIAATGLINVAVPRLYADNRRLLNRVTYDQLTGARTRTAFYEAAEEILAGRGRRPADAAQGALHRRPDIHGVPLRRGCSDSCRIGADRDQRARNARDSRTALEVPVLGRPEADLQPGLLPGVVGRVSCHLVDRARVGPERAGAAE